MNWVDAHVAEFAPDWFYRFPMKRSRHSVSFDLGHNQRGILLAENLHHWSGGEWQPVDYKPVPNRSGGFGFPHDPSFSLHPGGFITDGRVTSGLRSMGVMRHGQYVPIWKAGAFGVEHRKVRQSIGPYELEIAVGGGCSKTQLVLPHMPKVDGDALALDYFASGLVPPALCQARPFVKDANGRKVDMQKWRTTWGKQESIPLDVLASLAFPVVLDPEMCDGGTNYNIHGLSNFYATARSTASSHNAVVNADSVMQGSAVAPPFFRTSRLAVKTDATAEAGIIQGCELRWACYSTIDIANYQYDDTDFRFSAYDWDAQDPVVAGNREAAYDGILGGTPGGILGNSLYFKDTLGCNPDATCVYSPWYPLTPGDVAHLNVSNGLGNRLYYGLIVQTDIDNAAPAAPPVGRLYRVQGLKMTTPSSVDCPLCLRLTAGLGGWMWLIGG